MFLPSWYPGSDGVDKTNSGTNVQFLQKTSSMSLPFSTPAVKLLIELIQEPIYSIKMANPISLYSIWFSGNYHIDVLHILGTMSIHSSKLIIQVCSSSSVLPGSDESLLFPKQLIIYLSCSYTHMFLSMTLLG